MNFPEKVLNLPICFFIVSNMEGGPRRLTLWDQMSATEGAGLSGLSLEDVLGTGGKREAPSPPPPPPPPAEPEPQLSTRTLLDVIREEDPNSRTYKGLIQHRDKKSWKTFKDKLRLKRAGAVWISSVHVPTSDVPVSRAFNSHSRRNSGRHQTESTQPGDLNDNSLPSSSPSGRPQITRLNSTRLSPVPDDSTHFDYDDDSSDVPSPAPAPALTLRYQFSRHNSSRFGSMLYDDDYSDEEEENSPHAPTRRLSAVLEEARALSAREAVAAQEAAEAAAAAAREAETEIETEEGAPVVRMSLMDLMDYNLTDDDDDDDDEEVVEENGNGGEEVVEYNCCVCMVRHKGAAFIPCGHTFCRLCSRELLVTRGNCPLCNRFILEILDIF